MQNRNIAPRTAANPGTCGSGIGTGRHFLVCIAPTGARCNGHSIACETELWPPGLSPAASDVRTSTSATELEGTAIIRDARGKRAASAFLWTCSETLNGTTHPSRATTLIPWAAGPSLNAEDPSDAQI